MLFHKRLKSIAALFLTALFVVSLSSVQSVAAVSVSQTAKLTASHSVLDSFVGNSIAVNGNVVVVGAPGINDTQGHLVVGAAYVYVKPASGWANMTQVAKLTASDSGGTNAFGSHVAISGSTIVVGSNLPEIYIFEMPAGDGRT